MIGMWHLFVSMAIDHMTSRARMIPLSFLLLILLNLIITFAAAKPICMNGGNYTRPNSTYSVNLNNVFSFLSTNISRNGFSNASIGLPPDQANAVALCRGDLELDSCKKCVQNATIHLPKACPYQKLAIIWHEDCMLRYSNVTITNTISTDPREWRRNPSNATSPVQFLEELRRLLGDIRSIAANGDSQRKVAAGRATGPDSQAIYALVQCTPDLSYEDCDDCINDAASELPLCCSTRRGGTIFKPTCNIRFEDYLFFNETNLQGFVFNRTSVPSLPSGNDDSNETRTVIIVVISVIGMCIVVAFISAVMLRRRKCKQTGSTATGDENEISKLEYAFNIIRDATNGFSNENMLGKGGLGTLYKGILPNGKEIAVKRLSQDSGKETVEFKNEVALLARLLHKNLVKLLGFCMQGMEKLIVYEFVSNGNLDRFLFDPINNSYLDWNMRFKIIWGIARGLLYLHEDSELKVIHRNLKASNILLNKDMVPKITNFGIAKLFEQDVTHGTTKTNGPTNGYMSPEYAMHGHFSVKSDVFSFGVCVLEIISGQKNTILPSEKGESVSNLLSTAWKNWQDEASIDVVDPYLTNNSGFVSDMLKCIHIGLLCVQENPADRPTMAAVVLMLSSISITMASPSEPAFYFEQNQDET